MRDYVGANITPKTNHPLNLYKIDGCKTWSPMARPGPPAQSNHYASPTN